jgi:hypothetical protein
MKKKYDGQLGGRQDGYWEEVKFLAVFFFGILALAAVRVYFQ